MAFMGILIAFPVFMFSYACRRKAVEKLYVRTFYMNKPYQYTLSPRHVSEVTSYIMNNYARVRKILDKNPFFNSTVPIILTMRIQAAIIMLKIIGLVFLLNVHSNHDMQL